MNQINNIRTLSSFAARAGLVSVLVSSVLVLGGCGRGSNAASLAPVGPGPGPVQLNGTARSALEEKEASVLMAVDPARAKKAIDNFRINKREKAGPYQFAGADLNGDGQAEILVLFTGANWCAKTGCTLAILSPDNHKYAGISMIRRVKTPVRISSESTNGWRDLAVKTGGGGLPIHFTALKFGGAGYPGNATLLPVLPSGNAFDGEVAIASPAPDNVAVTR
ncbi:hypothetical protein MnTg02_02155 [bacterium MnTg02]|nr:hypothetical protein MnTg02_02155 [bacterium MnTg02]